MITAPSSLTLGLLLTALLAGCAGSSPSGDALASQLHSAYRDQPFKGGQPTPDHEWAFIDASQSRISFLHWMHEDSRGRSTGGDAEKADVLFATGDGFKGRWCRGSAGITQEQIDAGYVHFHKETSANWDAGHGATSPSQVGYWLRHVAARDGVEMMPGVVSKAGQVYPLMPTTGNLQDC
jgi:hypothetical protein